MPAGANPPKGIVVAVIALLFISIANNMKTLANNTAIRTVDFISILASGALAGVLLVFTILLIKNRNANDSATGKD
jgi:hypothetical protein